MNNFSYQLKTKVFFGKGEENNVGTLVKEYADSCLIVDDGGAYLEPLLKRVKESLDNAGVKHFELNKVQANPLLTTSNEGIKMVKDNNIGFVLAVGGGSVMDTAKFIAVGAHNDETKTKNIEIGFTTVVDWKVLPHGCISTLSGTGSEFSNCSMMVNNTVTPNVKAGLFTSHFCFDFAILNPELYFTLPARQTASGGVDAMSHGWENYFFIDLEEDLANEYYEGVCRTVIKNVPIALKDPKNYHARAELCLCSNLVMTNNLSTGGLMGDWLVHAIENPITTQFHKTHGETLGIMTLAYIKKFYKDPKQTDRFVRWATKCIGVEAKESKEATVEAGLEAFAAWLKSVGLSTTLTEYGCLDETTLRSCAEVAARTNYNCQRYGWDADYIMSIYDLAK